MGRSVSDRVSTYFFYSSSCGAANPVVPIGNQSMRHEARRGAEQAARDREIIRLVGMGVTYEEVGKQNGISRQRVHQIVQLYRDRSR